MEMDNLSSMSLSYFLYVLNPNYEITTSQQTKKSGHWGYKSPFAKEIQDLFERVELFFEVSVFQVKK